MPASIYIFSRDIQESTPHYRQSVAIYADDFGAARRILQEQLRKWSARGTSSGADIDLAYTSPNAWRTETVALDEPKVVSALVTR